MSAPYQVWVLDGRSPELLGSAADKGAARKLWRNSRNAVIASGGVVLETRTGTATRLVPALTLAVATAWREAGGAPPEPLPVPGTKVPGSKPAVRAARPKPAPTDEEELDDEGTEGDDDCDSDDPDDPPEVDLEAALGEEEREPERGPGDIDVHDLDDLLPSTPAPQESAAIATEAAPEPSTPAGPSPGAPGDPSPSAPSDTPEGLVSAPTPKRPRGRPRVDRTRPPAPPTPKKAPRDPRWQRMAGEAHTAFRLIARIGGLEQLRKLANPAAPPNPLHTVAAMAASELERLGMTNCCEWEVSVAGRPMRLTAQWVDGKSPLTLRQEALAERDAAVTALTAVQAASVRMQRLCDRAGGIERAEAIVAHFESMLSLGGAR